MPIISLERSEHMMQFCAGCTTELKRAKTVLPIWQTTFAEQMKLTKKTATRMRDSLLREGNLAVPLFILLDQARENTIYHSNFGAIPCLGWAGPHPP